MVRINPPRRTIYILALVLSGLIAAQCPPARASDDWELVKSDNGHNIDVYYRTMPTGNVEFKGVTDVHASLSAVVALFLDLEAMHRWVYSTLEVEKLKQISKTEMYIYTVHSMPFPFQKRDSVSRVRLTQDPHTKTVTIQLRNEPDFIERKEDLVRVPVAESILRLTPQTGNTTRVSFQGYGEPGGSVSSSMFRSAFFRWLVKGFLWRVPYETLTGLKKTVKNRKYQDQEFAFIREPYGSSSNTQGLP